MKKYIFFTLLIALIISTAYAGDDRVDGYPDGTGIRTLDAPNSSTAIWNDVFINGPHGGGILVYNMGEGGGGGTPSFYASNGLNKQGSTFGLGGMLDGDTEINLNGKELRFQGENNALHLNSEDGSVLPVRIYGFTSEDTTSGIKVLSGIAEVEEEDFPGTYIPAQIILKGDPFGFSSPNSLLNTNMLSIGVEDLDTTYINERTLNFFDGQEIKRARSVMDSKGNYGLFATNSLNLASDGSLNLNSDGSLDLSSDGSLNLSSNGGASYLIFNSDGSLDLSSNGGSSYLLFNSDGSLNLSSNEGASSLILNSDGSLNLNSDGSLDLSSDGSLNIKGALRYEGYQVLDDTDTFSLDLASTLNVWQLSGTRDMYLEFLSTPVSGDFRKVIITSHLNYGTVVSTSVTFDGLGADLAFDPPTELKVGDVFDFLFINNKWYWTNQ